MTGAGFAASGNRVTILETSLEKIERLRCGEIPFFEPQLPELVKAGIEKGLLTFVHLPLSSAGDASKSQGKANSNIVPEWQRVLLEAEVYFVAVGTPEGQDGSADLTAVFSVVDTLNSLPGDLAGHIVVNKSTVPVGTGDKVEERLRAAGKMAHVVSNPEFLKQGNAVNDFLKPERVVVGTESEAAAKAMKGLYHPLMLKRERVIVMNRRSAELVKYACNTFLATKISFINEISQICERLGADVVQVREGMITDSRIGDQFLFPGLGYGGSCFPKDVVALISQARHAGYEPAISRATHATNVEQKKWPAQQIVRFFNNDLAGKRIALWGISFKPNTDDLREAPSLQLMKTLVEAGAKISAYDPVAVPNARLALKDFIERGDITLCTSSLEAARGADALVLVTEWNEFRSPPWKRLAQAMKGRLIVDGRNIYDREFVESYGFTYVPVGVGSLSQRDSASSHFSASMAARQPEPAAVMA